MTEFAYLEGEIDESVDEPGTVVHDKLLVTSIIFGLHVCLRLGSFLKTVKNTFVGVVGGRRERVRGGGGNGDRLSEVLTVSLMRVSSVESTCVSRSVLCLLLEQSQPRRA